VDIRRGSWGGSVKRLCGYRQWQLSAFSLVISSEISEVRPALLYRDTIRRRLSSDPKVMTLNGYFTLSFVFMPIWLALTMQVLKNNRVEYTEDIHILSAT